MYFSKFELKLKNLLDEETISLHVSEYIEKKKLSLETGGSQSKLNKEQTELLIEHLEMRTYTTIQEIETSGKQIWITKT